MGLVAVELIEGMTIANDALHRPIIEVLNAIFYSNKRIFSHATMWNDGMNIHC